ncbi:MAG: hypothetical protein ACOC2U_04820 [bacterium]
MKQTYAFCKDFLAVSRGYSINERDYSEENSGEKESTNAIVEAECQYNDYFRKTIRYVISLSGKKVEVELNGKKKIMVKGRASLVLNASLDTDYNEMRSKGNNLRKFLDQVFHKYIAKDEQEKAIGDLIGDVDELIEKFKQVLNSETK